MTTQTHVPTLAALGTGAAAAIGRHLDSAFRAMVCDRASSAGPRYLRLLTGEPHPFGNFAVLSAPMDLDAVREVIDSLATAGRPAAIIFPDLDVPVAVGSYMKRLGFVPHGTMPAMAVDIADLKPTVLPDGYEFVRVGHGDDGEEWVREFAIGYDLPLGVAQCFSPVALRADTSPESPLQFFAVRRNGAIVCTSTCYLDGGLAGIYCVSTIPEERKKGLAAHATAEPLRLATRMGYRVGILQSSEAGHNLYKSLGFADFGGVPLYVRIPA